MKTEQEVRSKIAVITKGYQHILDCGPATIEINAPRALMQLEAVARLDTLYDLIGETRPRFTCDNSKKTNH